LLLLPHLSILLESYTSAKVNFELFAEYILLKDESEEIYMNSFQSKIRKNAIVEYLDYQIPVTQLMGPKEYGDMQAAKRD